MLSHTSRILAHLETGAALTPLEAWQRFGCYRLGARVYDLRKDGHPITTEIIEVETRDGTARVARYSLEA